MQVFVIINSIGIKINVLKECNELIDRGIYDT